jgi:hypothetical protein
VVNIVGSATLASSTGAALAADGLRVGTETDAAVPAPVTETLVRYHPGQVAEGVAVSDDLTGAVMLQADATVPAGVVDVDAGTTFAVRDLHPASGTTTTTPGPTAPAATVPAGPTAPSTAAPSTAAPTTAAPSTATTVPTPGGEAPSSSADAPQPWDPRPC